MALVNAIEHSTPRRRICPFSKRWWNDELKEARREANRLRNKFRRIGDAAIQEMWQGKLKGYNAKIKKEKWAAFVKGADEVTIWKLKKYMDTSQQPCHGMPHLSDSQPALKSLAKPKPHQDNQSSNTFLTK
jgi:hypothetical protein